MLVGSISSNMSFEQLWKAAEPYIIGVWKYRKPGEPVRWSATYLVDGAYWDAGLSETVEEALMRVILQRSHQVRKGLK
jgi:hypothetical protein